MKKVCKSLSCVHCNSLGCKHSVNYVPVQDWVCYPVRYENVSHVTEVNDFDYD